MSSQAQAADFAGATTTTTETEAPPVSTINISEQIASYAALCTESLGAISTTLAAIGAHRDNVFNARAVLNTVGPVMIKLIKDRQGFGKSFSAEMERVVSDYSALIETAGTSSEDLISIVGTKADRLANLQAELEAKLERNELALAIVSAALSKKLGLPILSRIEVLGRAVSCAEASDESDRGAELLWNELHMLQAFEVADLLGAEAVHAVLRWRDVFNRLMPVREHMHNLVQLFDSNLSDIMERLDREFSLGVQPETAAWIESLFDVLDLAIEAAQQSVNKLTAAAD